MWVHKEHQAGAQQAEGGTGKIKGAEKYQHLWGSIPHIMD